MISYYDKLMPDGTLIRATGVVDLRHECCKCHKILGFEEQIMTIHGEIICRDCLKEGTQYGWKQTLG